LLSGSDFRGKVKSFGWRGHDVHNKEIVPS
jgi:hypothetical protein